MTLRKNIVRVFYNLLNVGIQNSMNLNEVKITKLVNTLSLAGMILCICTFIFFFIERPVLVTAVSYIILILWSYLILFFNKKRQYTTARVLLITFGITSAFIFGILNASYLGIDIFLFSNYCLIIAIFASRRIIILTSSIVLLLLIISTYIHDKGLIDPIILYSSTQIFYNRIVVIIITSACIVAISWMFKSSNEVYETQLIHKNDQIQSSIYYASRIQKAILPPKEDVDKMLKDNFIFYRPRDIVSGDFYFCIEKGNKIFFGVGDCTGHGVPGAFMSMISMSFLIEIIGIEHILSPNEVLDSLDERIRNALHQEKVNNNDGVDIAICVIDNENKILEFSGAKSPLFIIQNGGNKVIKGDRLNLGGTIFKDGKFTKHTINISTPTTVYMYSDGYQDQIGGRNNKKFMSRNLQRLLYKVHNRSFVEQHEILSKNLDFWQNNKKQIDDILVLGAKIS